MFLLASSLLMVIAVILLLFCGFSIIDGEETNAVIAAVLGGGVAGVSLAMFFIDILERFIL